MTDQRMIGDILSERRHSLGLSIDRVVADTKLQRRMVEAFESSDFDAMPPKGYAQASLASYARYLGLNPNEILRIYDDQLYDYQRMSAPSSRSSSRRAGTADEQPRRTRSSRLRTEDDGYDRDDERDAGSRRRSTSSYRERSSQRDDWDRGARDDERGSNRTYDRGLYDSGYRGRPSSRASERPSSQRSSGRYEDAPARRPASRGADAYREERPAERYDRYDRDDRGRGGPSVSTGRGPVGGRSNDYTKHTRRETQVVTLDDGYQGGSGGPDGRDADIYRPRPARRANTERQSFSEVALGFVDSVRQDPRALPVIIGVVAVTIVVILVVSISACVRGNGGDGQDNTIPVTPMAGTTTGTTGTDAGTDGAGTPSPSTPLEPSFDPNAIMANSILALSVSSEAPTGPWIEVYVDDVGVHAQITPPGTSLQWTITRTATVKLSSIEYVQIFVNGTQVTPTLENGTYILTLNVPEDQWPQPEPAAPEGTDPEGDPDEGYYDDDGDWVAY